MAAVAPEQGGSLVDLEGAGAYRARGAVIKTRAVQLGLRTSGRAIADFTRLDRKTIDRVIGGLSITPATAQRILECFALDGEPPEALIVPIGPLEDRTLPGRDPGSV